MSTPRTRPPIARSFSGLDAGPIAILVALGMTVALLAARFSAPLFSAVALGGLLLAGYLAHRWPLPTLVAAAIVTLVDPVILPRFLPSGMDLGPIGAGEPLLAVSGAVITMNAVRRRRFGQAVRDPVLVLTGVFVALSVISALLNATPPVVALLGIVMTIDAIAIYFVSRMTPFDARGAAAAVAAVVGAGLLVALFGIAQVVIHSNLLGFSSFEGRFGEGGRITSFLGNPNMVAAVVGLTLPFPLYGSRHLPTVPGRWIARVALFILMLALLLTFSRGAWLGVGLGAIFGAVLIDWRSLPILVLVALVAWGAATVMPRNLVPSTGGTAPPPPIAVPDLIDTTVERFGSLQGEKDLRVRFIRDGLPIISDHMLLGVGPGRYGGAAASIIPSPIYDEYDTSLFRFRTVHNFWLHLLGEAGVLGTATFMVMILGLLIRFVRAARREVGVRFVVVAGAATMLLVAGLNSLTEMIFEGNMPVLLVWLVVGLASTMAPTGPIFGRLSGRARSG